MRPASTYSSACSATVPAVHGNPGLEFPMNRLLLVMIVCALGLSITSCHSRYGTPGTPGGFVVSGTVTGLTTNGLVLTDNGTNSVAVSANAPSFEFSERLESGGSYDVAIGTQPTGLTCSVTQGSGSNVQENVSDVSVSCAPETFVISGTIKGLTASGLTLQDNGRDDLTVAANSNSFEFSSPVAYGGDYDVTISAQPSGLTCTVSRAAGTDVTATVNDVTIACNATTYDVGGLISGLTTSGLTLENNAGDAIAVPANATSFQFTDPVSAGGAYDVTVATQPPGLVCSVGYGTGSDLQANVSTVQVTCASSTFTIGGVISGLTSNGLVLQNSGGDNLLVPAASSSFQFVTPVAYGGSYNVTVLSQPAGLTCAVTNGSSSNGTQNVVDVSVSCITNMVYIVVSSSGANGIVSPSTAQTVNPGGSVTFTATPDAGFAVDQWIVDGSEVQSGGSVYTLTNVSANATVAVTFAQTTLSLSISSLALSVMDAGLDASLTGTPRQIIVTNNGSIPATNVAVNSGTPLPNGTTMTTTCVVTLAPSSSCSITITPGTQATSDCQFGSAATPSAVSVSADDATTVQSNVSVLSFGCIYQGGYVYSIDDTTPTTSGVGGAVAAPADASAGIQWYNGTYVTTNASSLSDGASNTQLIVAVQGGGSYAASLCATSAVSGYSDWYLPAENELSLVYANVASNAIGNFASGDYWSSAEYNANPLLQAWAEDFSAAGAQVYGTKSLVLGVRCVRRMN